MRKLNIKKTKIWKLFSSVKLGIWLLSFIALVSMVGTLGLDKIYSAWWFILLLVLLSLNLLVCLINRFSLKLRLLGTIISHASILFYTCRGIGRDDCR